MAKKIGFRNAASEEEEPDTHVSAYKYLEDNYSFPVEASEATLKTTTELAKEILSATGDLPSEQEVRSAMVALDASTRRVGNVSYWLLISR
jgi:hypothetical protein